MIGTGEGKKSSNAMLRSPSIEETGVDRVDNEDNGVARMSEVPLRGGPTSSVAVAFVRDRVVGVMRDQM
jgi:hypothetical protein